MQRLFHPKLYWKNRGKLASNARVLQMLGMLGMKYVTATVIEACWAICMTNYVCACVSESVVEDILTQTLLFNVASEATEREENG